ncbi:hypothetical protein QJS66_06515 [Kocuria rhizophila]|nr:hypothetical protein QJS66_06515 [Kocuria rhizophila]
MPRPGLSSPCRGAARPPPARGPTGCLRSACGRRAAGTRGRRPGELRHRRPGGGHRICRSRGAGGCRHCEALTGMAEPAHPPRGRGGPGHGQVRPRHRPVHELGGEVINADALQLCGRERRRPSYHPESGTVSTTCCGHPRGEPSVAAFQQIAGGARTDPGTGWRARPRGRLGAVPCRATLDAILPGTDPRDPVRREAAAA